MDVKGNGHRSRQVHRNKIKLHYKLTMYQNDGIANEYKKHPAGCVCILRQSASADCCTKWMRNEENLTGYYWAIFLLSVVKHSQFYCRSIAPKKVNTLTVDRLYCAHHTGCSSSRFRCCCISRWTSKSVSASIRPGKHGDQINAGYFNRLQPVTSGPRRAEDVVWRTTGSSSKHHKKFKWSWKTWFTTALIEGRTGPSFPSWWEVHQTARPQDRRSKQAKQR